MVDRQSCSLNYWPPKSALLKNTIYISLGHLLLLMQFANECISEIILIYILSHASLILILILNPGLVCYNPKNPKMHIWANRKKIVSLLTKIHTTAHTNLWSLAQISFEFLKYWKMYRSMKIRFLSTGINCQNNVRGANNLFQFARIKTRLHLYKQWLYHKMREIDSHNVAATRIIVRIWASELKLAIFRKWD